MMTNEPITDPNDPRLKLDMSEASLERSRRLYTSGHWDEDSGFWVPYDRAAGDIALRRSDVDFFDCAETRLDSQAPLFIPACALDGFSMQAREEFLALPLHVTTMVERCRPIGPHLPDKARYVGYQESLLRIGKELPKEQRDAAGFPMVRRAIDACFSESSTEAAVDFLLNYVSVKKKAGVDFREYRSEVIGAIADSGWRLYSSGGLRDHIQYRAKKGMNALLGISGVSVNGKRVRFVDVSKRDADGQEYYLEAIEDFRTFETYTAPACVEFEDDDYLDKLLDGCPKDHISAIRRFLRGDEWATIARDMHKDPDNWVTAVKRGKAWRKVMRIMLSDGLRTIQPHGYSFLERFESGVSCYSLKPSWLSYPHAQNQ